MIHASYLLTPYKALDQWYIIELQVIFDTDPAPSGVSTHMQNEMMAQAMIRGVMDESGEQFVAYFLPTNDTLEKRQADFRQVKN